MQYAYCMQSKGIPKPTISLRLSRRQIEEIDEWVRRTGMRSRTVLIETAVERFLEEIKETKVVAMKPWTEAKAKAAIVKFLKTRPSLYVSEIIETLGIEPELAFRVVDSLLEGGVVDRAH